MAAFVSAALLASAAAFVSITDVAPTIVVDARYAGEHNFVGRPIAGYKAAKCLLTKPAAEALRAAQAELAPFGLGIKVYDCYRPQTAVNDFVQWAKDAKALEMRAEFYPRVPKDRLFADGYIAERSGHSRGSTVDLTLVPLPAPPEPPFSKALLVDCAAPHSVRFADAGLDMGTGYDCFDVKAHTANPEVSAEARRNRLLLKLVMERHGFQNYDQEWWHYTLKAEPFPETYFDHPVE